MIILKGRSSRVENKLKYGGSNKEGEHNILKYTSKV